MYSIEQSEQLLESNLEKAKRNSANRASGKRARVRKQRRIAELKVRCIELLQHRTGITRELFLLQEYTFRLGKENEWLAAQLRNLQERLVRLDEEGRALSAHFQPYKAGSQAHQLADARYIGKGLHAYQTTPTTCVPGAITGLHDQRLPNSLGFLSHMGSPELSPPSLIASRVGGTAHIPFRPNEPIEQSQNDYTSAPVLCQKSSDGSRISGGNRPSKEPQMPDNLAFLLKSCDLCY